MVQNSGAIGERHRPAGASRPKIALALRAVWLVSRCFSAFDHLALTPPPLILAQSSSSLFTSSPAHQTTLTRRASIPTNLPCNCIRLPPPDPNQSTAARAQFLGSCVAPRSLCFRHHPTSSIIHIPVAFSSTSELSNIFTNPVLTLCFNLLLAKRASWIFGKRLDLQTELKHPSGRASAASLRSSLLS